MANTRIQYLAQYKSSQEKSLATIIPGLMTDQQIKRIMDSLNRQNRFIPRKVGIPLPANTQQSVRLQTITETNEIENLNIDAETLTKRFEACKNKWYTSPDITV